MECGFCHSTNLLVMKDKEALCLDCKAHGRRLTFWVRVKKLFGR